MAKPITIFRASTGLNQKVDPSRVKFDGQTGVQDLTVAYNVDHDQTGRINRRKGYAVTARTEAVHSLWCDGGPCLFVTGTSLCLLGADMSYTALATVTSGATVDYEQVEEKAYWVNGYEKGIVENGSNSSWVRGTYYGPETKRNLSDPPIGTLVAAHSGHIYVARGKNLFYSDAYDFNAFDLSRGFLPFEHGLRMVRPVAGGIFVGTEAAVYFLAGKDPKRFEVEMVAESPVVRGTDVKLDLSDIGYEDLRQNMTGVGAMWTCHAGIYMGLPNGMAYNLTYKKLTKRSGLAGSGLVINDRYVALLNP